MKHDLDSESSFHAAKFSKNVSSGKSYLDFSQTQIKIVSMRSYIRTCKAKFAGDLSNFGTTTESVESIGGSWQPERWVRI